MTRYATNLARASAQQLPIPGREAEMSRNDAGGFGFTLDNWTRLRRFLILGAEGGTFYVTEQKLTVDNAQAALACLREDGPRFMDELTRVHGLSLAPKWQPAVFCLALASVFGDEKTKQIVAGKAPVILRNGAQLLAFVASADALGKWRRNLRRTIQAWVDARDADTLAYQAVKYQSRDGWALRDVLRLSHATSTAPAVKAVLDRICGRDAPDESALPRVLQAEREMRAQVNEAGNEAALGFVSVLPREALPSEVNAMPGYWRDALAQGNLPATALLRNLAQMTRLGLFEQGVEFKQGILERLQDHAGLARARVHPMAALLAFAAYDGGGTKGQSRGAAFTPDLDVAAALVDYFEKGFTQRRKIEGSALIAVDVSGSMGAPVNGTPALTAKEAAAALAVALARSFTAPEVLAFNEHCPAIGGRFAWRDSGLPTPFPGQVTAASSYQEALRTFGSMTGGTNCASPIQHLTREGKAVDAIVIISDQDSWHGTQHVSQAMATYRSRVNAKTRLIVMALTGIGTTLVDPKDPLALGMAGFDAGAMTVLESFLRGDL